MQLTTQVTYYATLNLRILYSHYQYAMCPTLWFTKRVVVNTDNGTTTYQLSDYANAEYMQVEVYIARYQGYYPQDTYQYRYNSEVVIKWCNSSGTVLHTDTIDGSNYTNTFNIQMIGHLSYWYYDIHQEWNDRISASQYSPINIQVGTSGISSTTISPSSRTIPLYAPNFDIFFYSMTINALLVEGTFVCANGYAITGGNYTATMGTVNIANGYTFTDTTIYFSSESAKIGRKIYDPVIQLTLATVQIPSFTIANQLTNVTTDNPSTHILSGESYTAHLTPTVSGEYINFVRVTMGGRDITAEVYSNGTIDIDAVTGNLIIEARTGDDPEITYELTGVTLSSMPTTVSFGSQLQLTVTADSGYSLDGAYILVIMGGVEQFDVLSGNTLTIPYVNGDVSILIRANTIKTFVFKSMDGQTTYATYTGVRITRIKFELNGSTRTLFVNNTRYDWTVALPEDKSLYGLALTQEAERWLIPVNADVIVNYTESMTFYEVILDEQGHITTTSLMLYKNRAENHKVDKSNDLTSVGTLDGVFRKECSIITPEITIEYDLVDFNYVYIPVFNRYYFVTDIIYLKKGLVHISLKVDVLMSYRDKIYNQKGFIGRNEYTYNEEVIDAQRVVKNNPIVEVKSVETNGIINPNDLENNIIVNVVGGD